MPKTSFVYEEREFITLNRAGSFKSFHENTLQNYTNDEVMQLIYFNKKKIKVKTIID